MRARSISLLFLIIHQILAFNPPCSPSQSLPIQPGDLTFLANGTVLHGTDLYPEELVWHETNSSYGCFCEINKQSPCLVKCCEKNQVLSDNGLCTDVDQVPGLHVHPEHLHHDVKHIKDLNNHFRIFSREICPGDRLLLEPESSPNDNFTLLANGSLLQIDQIIPPGQFCLDWDEKKILRVLVCIKEAVEAITVFQTTHQVGIIISIPFFIVTFCVYAIIPKLRNLYGMTLMCYVGCLITAYLFLVFSQMIVYYGGWFCTVIPFVIHFSFLSSFFWLNVMCFDIWWTFGGFRGLEGSVQLHERKKFIIYSVYAWGCASIMTGLCIIMDYAPGIPDYYIKPKFGEESCWFSDDASKAIYFYGPMGLTVICNICLFISTALKILKHKRDTATQLQGTDSRRHDDNKQWFNLYLKLFIVMGINWAMEIISWLLNKNTPDWVWYLTDLTNTLQGVIIFIIFVWKDRIKNLLMKRFGCSERSFQSRNSTRSGCNSSISTKVSASTAPLQDKNHFSFDKNRVDTTTTDESDFV